MIRVQTVPAINKETQKNVLKKGIAGAMTCCNPLPDKNSRRNYQGNCKEHARINTGHGIRYRCLWRSLERKAVGILGIPGTEQSERTMEICPGRNVPGPCIGQGKLLHALPVREGDGHVTAGGMCGKTCQAVLSPRSQEVPLNGPGFRKRERL